jgi:hypothetical protein
VLCGKRNFLFAARDFAAQRVNSFVKLVNGQRIKVFPDQVGQCIAFSARKKFFAVHKANLPILAVGVNTGFAKSRRIERRHVTEILQKPRISGAFAC